MKPMHEFKAVNQRMAKTKKQKGQPLVYVAKSTVHGRGVFARVDIRSGQTIGVFEWVETRRDGKFVLWTEEEDGSETGCRGTNELRYLNHSKRPNAEFDEFDVVAIRNIKADAEIMIDYGW